MKKAKMHLTNGYMYASDRNTIVVQGYRGETWMEIDLHLDDTFSGADMCLHTASGLMEFVQRQVEEIRDLASSVYHAVS